MNTSSSGRTTYSRRRLRTSALAMVAALAVLVGCAKTVDGQASVDADAPAISTSSSSSSTSSSSSSSSESSTESSSESSSSESTSESSSSSEPTSASTPSTTSSSSSTETSTSTSSTETSATFTGNPDNLPVTEPGKQLKYGESATVPVTYAGADGIFTLSNLTVTKGSEADWATLGVDLSDAQGEEPWYVKMTLKQESGGDFSYTSVQNDLWAYTADGDLIFSEFPPETENTICPDSYAPEGFTVGSSYEACTILSVNVGESVDRVQFEGDYSEDNPYTDSPIVWKG